MEWFVDEFFGFRDRLWIRGWAYDQNGIKAMEYRDGERRSSLSYGDHSADVEKDHGAIARNCRFHGDLPTAWSGAGKLYAQVDGEWRELNDPCGRKLGHDPYHQLQSTFYKGIDRGKVLEIGSRNRSGVVRRSLFAPSVSYTGLDIKTGDNVDIVGDAHRLSALFPPSTFDAIFACSVFEHLLMPWKAAIEINKILRLGGMVMLTTHQTWPLHDTPWDYWRFSDMAWHAIFNRCSGFQILETALGEPAFIVPSFTHAATDGLDRQPARLGCSVIAKKTGETSLEWDVPAAELINTVYPA
jgi:hypothetical protein